MISHLHALIIDDSMATEKINLQPLKDEGLNDWEEKVVATFEKAFESLSKPGLDDAAKLTATQLQELIPFDAQPNNIEFLFERLWAVVANIAKYVPYRHQGQAFLVQVLVALNSSGDPWKGLPYLVICLRDNWIGTYYIYPPLYTSISPRLSNVLKILPSR